MAYVPPPSFYDIYPNDYVNWNYGQLAGNFARGAPAGTPRYGLQHPGGGVQVPAPVPVPVPSMRAQPPAIQVPAPVERTSSAGSSPALSSSSQSTPSGASSPSVPLSQGLAQPSESQDVSLPDSADAPVPARRRPKRIGPPRRRGPNKRHAGSGYVDMMSELPEEVQNALRQEYKDCCEVVKDKDASTVQKHRFTKRHFLNLEPRLQRLLPAFTCPAFVGLHEKCKSAKAGRYDSTERHCTHCPGFQELRANSHVDTLYPFAISKEEFDAVQKFRKTLKPGKKVDAPALVEAVIVRLITMLTGATSPPEPAFSSGSPLPADQVPGPAGAAAAEDSEQASPFPPPAAAAGPSSSSAQPQQQSELLLPADPIFDFAGNGGAVPQEVADAAAAWLDIFGNVDAFAPGAPGVPLLGLQAPHGLYPAANNFAWHNVAYDPAVFGPFFG